MLVLDANILIRAVLGLTTLVTIGKLVALRCPIWTEDTGFFGCGVAIRTTDRVELYLAG